MTRGVVQVPGGELAWVAEGAGRPLVLLHAGSMDASSWAAAAAALAPGHAVVRYDARGHGASSVPTAPYAHHEDLRAVLDALGLPRAVLAGVSLGARTALDLALVAPERVEGLFLVSPGLSGMTFHDPFVLQQVRVPLRVVVGALDAADILEAGRRLAAEVPGARLEVVPGAGHMVDQERPEVVLRALRDFLGGLPAAPALA